VSYTPVICGHFNSFGGYGDDLQGLH